MSEVATSSESPPRSVRVQSRWRLFIRSFNSKDLNAGNYTHLTPSLSNQSVLESTGLRREDVMADAFRSRLFHPDDLERVRDRRQHGLEHSVPFPRCSSSVKRGRVRSSRRRCRTVVLFTATRGRNPVACRMFLEPARGLEPRPA